MGRHFDTALRVLGAVEGGYSDDPKDSGGATNRGISLRFLTQLVKDPYWAKEFTTKSPTKEHVRRITEVQAARIYRREFWDRYRCEDLPWPCALLFFVLVVNTAPAKAVRVLQEAINYSGGQTNVDGLFGPHTLAQAGRCDPHELAKRFEAFASMFYADLGRAQPHFLRGWMYRSADALWHAAIYRDLED